MDDKKEIKVIKIGIIGDSCVGKSPLCSTYVLGESTLDSNSTIGDKHETKFKLKNGKEIKLLLFDSLGQERHHTTSIKTMKYCHGVIIVSSVVDKNSFENIENWKRSLDDENIKCFAVFGNKIDLPKDEWKITSEEAKNIAQKNGLPYFEISCKTREGMEEGMDYVVNKIYETLENKNNNSINLKVQETKKNSNSNCVGNKKNK